MRAAAPLVALTALAALVRFYAIGRQGFWYDEAFTVLLVKQPFTEMISTIPRTESTPPLYYCIVWVWAHVFGDGPVALRSLSSLFGVATVPLMCGAVDELTRRRVAGLVVAALVACNPLLVWYSQEARAYELLVLLCAAQLWAFLRAQRTGETRPLAVWGALSVLALLTHYYAVLVIVPEALWLLYRHPRSRALWIGLGCIAVCGGALVPLAAHQDNGTHNAWMASIPLGVRLGQIMPMSLLGTGAPARTALKFAAFALGLAAIVIFAVRGSARDRRAALAMLALALAGFAIALLSPNTLLLRNLLAALAPGLAFLAIAIASCRTRLLTAALTAALCTVGLIAVGGVDAEIVLQRPDWPGVARALGPWSAAGGRTAPRLIIIQRNHGVLGVDPLEDYLSHVTWVDRDTRPSLHIALSQIDIIGVRRLPGQGRARDCWWGAACDLFNAPLRRHYAIAGFHVIARRVVHQFTILILSAPHPTVLHGGDLLRALGSFGPSRTDAMMLQRPGQPARDS